ncbi:unnamed protein product [Owenia fusiformis]|uniref:Uncharacterized protein n=1 Tax=Owenia fusiformis TaxID=6347 RepID=A0A8S4Q9P1_OWEFU|nr:unnamed protein product [Owenia fusiformis]
MSRERHKSMVGSLVQSLTDFATSTLVPGSVDNLDREQEPPFFDSQSSCDKPITLPIVKMSQNVANSPESNPEQNDRNIGKYQSSQETTIQKEPEKNASKCEYCQKNASMLECEYCRKWSCLKCQNVPKPMWKAIHNHQDLHWYCRTCEPIVENKLSTDGKNDHELDCIMPLLKEQLANITSNLDECFRKQNLAISNKIAKLQGDLNTKLANSRVPNQLNEIRDKIDRFQIPAETDLKNAMNEAARNINENIMNEATKSINIKGLEDQMQGNIKNLQSKIDEVKTIVQKSEVKPDLLSELEEREKRKYNLVLQNVPESLKQTPRQRQLDDNQLVNDIIEYQLSIETKVVRSMRLGRPREDGEARPLQITLEDQYNRNEILRAAPKLRRSAQWGTIFI